MDRRQDGDLVSTPAMLFTLLVSPAETEGAAERVGMQQTGRTELPCGSAGAQRRPAGRAERNVRVASSDCSARGIVCVHVGGVADSCAQR